MASLATDNPVTRKGPQSEAPETDAGESSGRCGESRSSNMPPEDKSSRPVSARFRPEDEAEIINAKLPATFEGLVTDQTKGDTYKKTSWIQPSIRKSFFPETEKSSTPLRVGSPVRMMGHHSTRKHKAPTSRREGFSSVKKLQPPHATDNTSSSAIITGHFSIRKHASTVGRNGIKRKLSDPESEPLNEKKTKNDDFHDLREDVTKAFEKEESEGEQVGDFSRCYCLPTVPGHHADLKYITSDTVADIVAERLVLPDKLTHLVVDCRYPYEFSGGHIQGSVNLYTHEKLSDFLQGEFVKSDENRSKTVLIFHCEFSCDRAPKRMRFLRNCDRNFNAEHYPRLTFPEMYVMAGGYRDFFARHVELCTPPSYVPMLHEEHKKDLLKYRGKSKSSAARDKSARKGDSCSPRENKTTSRVRLEY